MARRKRKHIPVVELLASVLAEHMMPAWERQARRVSREPARKIVSLYTADHVELHAWGGKDKWWNLTMTRRGPALQAKDRADTSRAAKAVRIDKKWRPFVAAMAKGRKPPKEIRTAGGIYRWPPKSKSRWPSRPFPKRRKP